MQLIRSDTHIDFLSQTRLFVPISIGVVVLSLLLMIFTGINWGIEFVGGSVIEVRVPPHAGDVDEGVIRAAVADAGYPKAVVVRVGASDSRDYRVQVRDTLEQNPKLSLQIVSALNDRFGIGVRLRRADAAGGRVTIEVEVPEEAGPVDEQRVREGVGGGGGVTVERVGAAGNGAFRVSLPARDGDPDLAAELVSRLNANLDAGVDTRKVDSIGPRVGAEMRRAGFISVGLACVLILLYVWLRFDLRYAPGAVAALVHDVIITAGVFVAVGLEFNLQVVAALLVVIGYSLNDTIVIYDRIRENTQLRGTTHLPDVVNQSVNQTLSRTLLTTITTLIVVVALLVAGGPVIRDFAVALIIGVTVGTYSTIYVASALLIALERYYATRARPAA